MNQESWASSDGVRRSMRGNRGRDTGPEMAVRRLLHARGLRYRVDLAPVAGVRRRADLVFTRARVAVFIDGCFWHGCPQHATWPKVNADFWHQKIEGNRARDRDTDQRLREAEWTVLRFWEHEAPEDVAEAIQHVVKQTRLNT